jgi:hypothetical protein
MIDFTTIQTYPVPPILKQLQETNSALNQENEFITNLLIAVVVGGAIYIGFQIYKSEKQNEQRPTIKPKGN